MSEEKKRTVRTAKSAGFCFGVKRAVDKVYEQIGKGEPIYTFGPIIHNEEVVRDLQEKGVQVLHNLEELDQITKGTIVIRSHGIGKQVYDQIKKKKLNLVDATCPFVLKIHRIVERESKNGRDIIIIGNEHHPEVEGIKGWCSTPVTIIDSTEKAVNLDAKSADKFCIVSQTTFNYKKFKDLVEIIMKKGYDILVLNTICNATEERQAEAKQLSVWAEAMIVVGGKESSNTQKLFEICKRECENTYYIQTLNDLDVNKLQSISNVGITAGASTPNNIIEEVQKNVRNEF